MAKFVPDSIIDLQLDQLENTNIYVCSAQPTDHTSLSGITLATQPVSGAYTKANGDTSGRKTTVPAQSGVSITATDTATHVALSNGTDTLTAVTTCTSQPLTSGGTVDIPAWDMEIADPV
jgi:hypothetical protein